MDYVREAERLGIPEVWFPEDLGFRGAIAQAGVTLAATRSLAVGVGIMPAGSRNPYYAAMEIATLGRLFPGRLRVGFGKGMTNWVASARMAPADVVTVIDVCRQLVNGRGTAMTRPASEPSLQEPPRVPVPLLAGLRGPRALSAVAHSTDGLVLAEPATAEYLERVVVPALRGVPMPIVAYNFLSVGTDQLAALDAARDSVAELSGAEWAAQVRPLPFADNFWRLRDESASASDLARNMPAEWVTRLAIVGNAATCSARLVALEEMGVSTNVAIPVSTDFAAGLRQVAQLPAPA